MLEIQEIEKVIQEALARGYCTKENENKEVDVTLMSAMVEELMIVFDKTLPETVVLGYQNLPKGKSTVSDLLDALIVKERNKR